MEVCAYLVADPESLELVEPGERPLYDPTRLSQPGAMGGAFASELRCDAAGPQKSAVLVVVVAAVGEQTAWPVTWPTAQPADAGYRVQQGHQLSDVVTIPAGQRDGQRSAMPVDDQVVLAAGPGPVDRRRSGVSPPFSARTCEPSIEASSMSSRPAARNSPSSTSCSCGQTPASVQSRRRRQAVTPLHPTCSAGTSRQLTPLHST